MSTTSLIDRIIPFAKGWNRTGNKSILQLIEEGQDEYFDYDADYMVYRGTDNEGWPPYLLTTLGTYRYEITSTNLSATLTKTIGGTAYPIRCRRVVEIFVDTSTDYDYNRTWLGRPYIAGYDNPYRVSNDRIEVAAIPCHNSSALENTAAYIDFIEDPGTSTEIYFCKFVWEPPRLASESVPLTVPKLYETGLRKYVMGTIQELSSGKSSAQLAEFYNLWVPRFRKEMDLGPIADTLQTEIQPY